MPGHLRSRTIRAAALVGLSLTAAGCDDPPLADAPPGIAERQAACEAAHRRLGADPANCAALELAEEQAQRSTAPRYRLQAQCEASFGQGACEGGVAPAFVARRWQPVADGWSGTDGTPEPILRDSAQRLWQLRGTDANGVALPPVEVQTTPVPQAAMAQDARARSSLARLVPQYASQLDCERDWARCEAPQQQALSNRFTDRASCEAVWTQCTEATLPVQTAGSTTSSGAGGGHGGGHGGGGRWWYHYNDGWMYSTSTGYRPRYQGWSWTADRQPVAAYRAGGTRLAWDSSTSSLAPARSLVTSGGSEAGAARTSSISRAGFGSTGRSVSAGG